MTIERLKEEKTLGSWDIAAVWTKLVELNAQSYFDIHLPAPWDAHSQHQGLTLVRRDQAGVRHWLKVFDDVARIIEESFPQAIPEASYRMIGGPA